MKAALEQWESLLAFVLRACEQHLPRRFWPFPDISSAGGLHTWGARQVHASPFIDEGSESEASQLPLSTQVRGPFLCQVVCSASPKTSIERNTIAHQELMVKERGPCLCHQVRCLVGGGNSRKSWCHVTTTDEALSVSHPH